MPGNMFRCFGATIALAIGLNATARGQVVDLSISGGYSHAFGTHDSLFHATDGGYVDADFGWKLPAPAPITLGFGLTGSGYYDSHQIYPGAGDSYNYYYDNNLYSDVGFFEFEPRISVTIWSKDIRGLYVRPRFGLGVLVDSYSVDHATYVSNGAYVDTYSHTGAAFEIRPAVQVGYAWGPGAAGVEASYMPAWGDFGQLGSSVQELRLGVFYTFRY